MKYKILLICIFTILLTTFVSAFGVTAFYWEDRPLIMNPGETKEISFLLQNEQTSDPVSLEAELTQSSNIAELTGKTVYSLNSGQSGVPVRIKVSIPETAQIGEKYTVGISLTTIKKPGKHMLGMGTQIGKSIPIVVGKIIEPKKSIFDIIPLESIGGVVILLALVILIAFVMYRKKKKK